jgi:histidinol phosphatase-like PHP family hydrolase
VAPTSNTSELHIVSTAVIQLLKYTMMISMKRNHIMLSKCLLTVITVSLSVCGCAAKRQSIKLVDYHVHLKGGLTLPEAIAMSKANGIKYGIAANCGLKFPVTDDKGLREYVASVKGKGAYVAMQAEGREWVTLFSPEAIAECDYVFSDALTWRDHKNRRMRLWIPAEVFIDDKQQFMDMYVDRIVWIIDNEPIDIFVNPTLLPKAISAEYDALWIEARKKRFIDAAVRNNVAIEINARHRLPKPDFLKKAKAAGAKFAFGTNNGGRKLGKLEYCIEMIDECGLTPQDMFTPKTDGKKAIQLKKLPKLKY